MSTLTAEILDISAEDYHANRFSNEPACSKSSIQKLIDKSPAHARAAHPILNPDLPSPERKKAFDLGTAVHALFLESDDSKIHIVAGYDTYNKKAAQEERDAAYAAGLTPLLEKDLERVQAVTAAIRPQLDAYIERPALFADGKAEQTVIWEEDDLILKMRPDWLHNDYSAIEDLKTTSVSGSPEAWQKTMLGMGADLTDAFYRRGMRALTGRDCAYRFVVVELEPPYELSVFSPAPDVRALAERKVSWAIAKWRQCLQTDHWPGYPKRVIYVQSTAWAETQWAEREYRDSIEEETA